VYAPIHDDAKRAVELDAFCGNLDLLVGVNLMRADHSAIPGTRLRGTLEAEGFHLNEHGAFEMGSEDGQHMLYEIRNAHGQPMTADSLRNDGVHGLSLTLDVMRVPNPVQHFDMMRTLAKRLATRLEAVMVDDRGHALTDALMQKIRGELEKRVTAARTAGIEPGSPLARTLFGE
jgi:FtsZ-interacting cell division protein ZipA